MTTKNTPTKEEPKPTPKVIKVTLRNDSKRPIRMPNDTILGTRLDEALVREDKAHPVEAEFTKEEVEKWRAHPVTARLFDKDIRVVA